MLTEAEHSYHIKEERRGTSWARATSELRRLRQSIEAVGGSKDQYPQQVCRGLVQLLLRKQVDSEEAQRLAKQIGSRLPPGWGATWTERGFGELTGTRTDQQPLVVDSLHSLRQKGEGPGAPSTVTSNVKFINLHFPRQCDTVGEVKSLDLLVELTVTIAFFSVVLSRHRCKAANMPAFVIRSITLSMTPRCRCSSRTFSHHRAKLAATAACIMRLTTLCMTALRRSSSTRRRNYTQGRILGRTPNTHSVNVPFFTNRHPPDSTSTTGSQRCRGSNRQSLQCPAVLRCRFLDLAW